MTTVQFKPEDLEDLKTFRKLMESSFDKRFSIREVIMIAIHANFPTSPRDKEDI